MRKTAKKNDKKQDNRINVQHSNRKLIEHKYGKELMISGHICVSKQ
jgi:hypothetical protein